MKKLILFLALFVCLYSSADSQLIYYQWNPVSSPVTNNLNQIYYFSSNYIIAGNDGKLLYRLYQQPVWNVAVSGVTANLNSLSGPSVLYSVGASGVILKSTDNGVVWSSVASPTANNINSISAFISPPYRIICTDGGKIFTSINNGVNWTEIPSGTTNSLRSIYYNSSISQFRNYICGDNGAFLKLVYLLPLPPATTVIPINTGVTNNLYGVTALGDTSKIMVVGSGGMILKSTESGGTWVQQTSGTTNTLRFVYAVNANEIFVGGDNGTILRTTNGGTNWFPQVVNSSANIYSMLQTPDLKALAVGSGGTILETNLPNPINDSTIKRIKLDGNNISSYFQTSGIFNQNTTNGNSAGFEWPKGSGKYAMFTSGLSISALVNGNLRQAMCSFRGEYWPGQIIGGVPKTPIELNRIWKVSAGENCSTSVDWANWGLIVPYGAPYRDVNNNGVYDPCTDIPGMRNATQTVFMALTDGYQYSHSAGEYFGGGTFPLNADIKITAYCYGDSSVSDVQYIKYDIINRGSNAWNNVYMSFTGDFDLGEANDDYLASDSARNMWIGYNADNMDGNGTYQTYGANPPAVGMRIIKFPVNKTVSPYDTLRAMTVSHQFCGGCIAPQCEFSPSGEPLGAYNFLKGFKKDGSNWMNPILAPPRPTKFQFPGEPETNTGWTEFKGSLWNCGGDTGAYHPVNTPGDRRFLLGMGKENFTMNPGDSQSIVVAQFIARGTSNLNSVTKLKQLADVVANYTVGINHIGIEVPGNFVLTQNYPNPFNPETKIKFTIPGFSTLNSNVVTLRVFDMLGREVSVLVNDRLSPGIYEVTFDGSKLSSGMYFYKLQMDKYTDSKRMVLIK